MDYEKDIVYSQAIKAGKRIYYLDVKRNRKDELFLSITESKKVTSGEGPDAPYTFEKHKIFLYQEDFSKFIDGLSKAVGYIHQNQSEGARYAVSADNEAESDDVAIDSLPINDTPLADDLKIEIDFE